MAGLEPKLAQLQRELKNMGVPVMIVFEGFGAAGKGTQINRLIQALERLDRFIRRLKAEQTAK